MPAVLNVIALVAFAASLSLRGLDPVLPQIAADFDVSIASAAGLAAITAFTFAIVQPFLGAAADMFGKARTMIVCMVLLGIANIVGACATSFTMLFASRVLTGISAGGLFPVAVSLTGDLVTPDKRQVAIGRVIAGSMAGTLLGASASGIIGDFFGWRGVLVVLGVLALLSAAAVAGGFGLAALMRPAAKVDFAAIRRGYREIFTHPNAPIIFTAVFVEGCCVLGLVPYMAAFLLDLGVTSLSIAGFVISGFAIGGLIYTVTVSRLLARFAVAQLMTFGGIFLGVQVAVIAWGPSWPVQMLVMAVLGWSFYLLHGSLQVFSTELSATARASAVSLHNCFFFLGQTVGPIAYGFGIEHAGKEPTLFVAALLLALTGCICAKLLRPIRAGAAT